MVCGAANGESKIKVIHLTWRYLRLSHSSVSVSISVSASDLKTMHSCAISYATERLGLFAFQFSALQFVAFSAFRFTFFGAD